MTHPAILRKQTAMDHLSGKTSKEKANYRPAEGAHATKNSCAECEHYTHPGQPTSSCAKVAGMVAASDTCDLFSPATSSPHDSGQGTSVHVSLHVQPPSGR